MPKEKDIPRDTGGHERAYAQPPTDKSGQLVVDSEARSATEKAEKEALDRAGGTKVPNSPIVGISPADAVPNVRPAGEARPSIEVPTYAPPEQTGGVIGVAVEDMPPPKGKNADRLHKVEQRLAWLIQHQPPTCPPNVVPSLAAALARTRAARYSERGIDEAGMRGIENLLAGHVLPEAFD